MTKHTRGPWRARRHNDDPRYRWAHVLGSDGEIVATFTASPARTLGDDEVGANAHLIAAAPDLLDVARDALERLDMIIGDGGTARTCARLRAAIAKAEGRAPDSG